LKQPTFDLTEDEKVLLHQIDFDPGGLTDHSAEYWIGVGAASEQLMSSLLSRNAIPEIRKAYLSDATLNVGGRGKSRLDVFERNGTRGPAIFRHPHFLKYLHYLLYGPDLPEEVAAGFTQEVQRCGMITSGDIFPLGKAARSLAKRRQLEMREAAEEFFKFALECGLDASDAEAIRSIVRR
jgi:hypothetical protein